MSEPIPKVAFDTRLGELFEYADINHEALVAYMQEQGFSDDDINKTVIHIRADHTGYEDEGQVFFTDGYYNRKTGEIVLYPAKAIYMFELETKQVTREELIDQFRYYLSRLCSQEYSSVLAHELGHKMLNPADPPEDAQLLGFATESFKGLMLRKEEHKQYEEDPEEVYVESLERASPNNLVTLQIKKQPAQLPQPIDISA